VIGRQLQLQSLFSATCAYHVKSGSILIFKQKHLMMIPTDRHKYRDGNKATRMLNILISPYTCYSVVMLTAPNYTFTVI
jgi:hypothetical protein